MERVIVCFKLFPIISSKFPFFEEIKFSRTLSKTTIVSLTEKPKIAKIAIIKIVLIW